MKISISILLLMGLTTFGFGQNRKQKDFGLYNSLNLGVGYNYSFGDPNEKNFHLLDLGINKARYGGRHGGGFQYGIGTEVALNTENFVIGPKVNGVIYFQGLVFGAELITYTDFDNYTLRFVPFIGIGGEKFKFTINPHVILTNKDFRPIDNGLVSLTVNLSLRKKKVELNGT